MQAPVPSPSAHNHAAGANGAPERTEQEAAPCRPPRVHMIYAKLAGCDTQTQAAPSESFLSGRVNDRIWLRGRDRTRNCCRPPSRECRRQKSRSGSCGCQSKVPCCSRTNLQQARRTSAHVNPGWTHGHARLPVGSLRAAWPTQEANARRPKEALTVPV